MKNLYILCVIFLFSCQKSIDKIAQPPKINSEKETCSFEISEFNMSKRPPINYEAAKGRPITSGPKSKNGSSGGTTTSGGNVILLDFDGQSVSNTSWNATGTINCAPSNLTEAEQAVVFQRVATDFSSFNIIVTTDETVYNNANPYRRMRVIVTESWEWFGQAGGVSYINSFTWGDNTPCFVFSSLLGYNVKKIAEASSHEAGHTLGLRHQSVYDANGAKIAEYNPGQGVGEIGWAPIMGVSYNRNLTLWHNGTSSSSYNTYQNDVSIIAGVVGYANDDYSNSFSGAASLTSSFDGLINNTTDVDFFSINITGSKTVSVFPQNVGINNEGGNLDLVLSVYNGQGSLIATINDPNILSASTVLQPGSYYVSVSTSDNSNTLKYGMLSRYSINLN